MQQPMMQQPMQKQRPTGVTILAVLALIGGVFAILAGLALLALGGLASSAGAALGADASTAEAMAAASSLGGLGTILGIVLLATGLLDLVFAIGAFGLKPWALPLGIIAQVLSLLSTGYQIVSGSTDFGSQIINIAIPVLIIVYLMSPGVKQAFAKN